jgi:hypothetical protein
MNDIQELTPLEQVRYRLQNAGYDVYCPGGGRLFIFKATRSVTPKEVKELLPMLLKRAVRIEKTDSSRFSFVLVMEKSHE